MKKEELIQKLEDIEWEDFEVKTAASDIPKSSWETVSSFSNTAGGWLIFGVKKNGKNYEILGVKNPEKTEHDFIGVLKSDNKFNKIIEVKSKRYNFVNKTVLAFYIPQRSPRDKPIYFNSQDNTFIRTGSGDQRATKEEIDTFYRLASFEEKDKELTKFKFEDLDKETIEKYRNYFGNVNPGHRYSILGHEEFLQKIGVLKEGKVTYGGLLVFGSEDCLSDGLINHRIEYLEIDGNSYEDAPTRYSFRISSEKNLFLTFFDIYERIGKKIDIPFSVKAGLRDDDPPHLQAMREAFVNLLIHTDYFSQSNPRIRMFRNHFEFFNPGALPKKIELIIKEDFSLPRNPIVAKIFRFVKFSENIGSGFHKMFGGWKKQYKFNPIIDGDFDYYKITFPKTKNVTITNTITNTITKGDNKEKEILKILENNPYLSAEQIAKLVGLSVMGVRYHLNNLKTKNRIRRKGHGKGGSWEILK